ncbi:MAG TPA: hypothetical protein VK187_04400 [Geobacteraceae bacterium]|nr:hypothetical protein [Geobacteraceae bacterium]
MPGSYPDPRSSANSAIQMLEEAYEKSHDTHTGSLILKAIAAIGRLKEEIVIARSSGVTEYDPYEINESNSAL